MISRKWLIILIGYSSLIAYVAVGRNSRSAVLIGIASIILVYFLSLAIGIYKLRQSAFRNIIITIIGLLILSGPVNDLALSMVVVRGIRTDLPAVQLISKTFTVFQDKEILERYRENTNKNITSWDEHYVNNLFMARLCNLKFADNSIDLALSMTNFSKKYIRAVEFQKVLATFPSPLIKILGLPVDKNFVGAASSGDFMLYAVTGKSYVLGGFRTGSIFGNGFALFSWWYPFVLAILTTFLFSLADALTSRTRVSVNRFIDEKYLILSPMVVISFFSWFFNLTSAATGTESLSILASYVLRGWIQGLFVYALLYWCTYYPLKMIQKKYVA